MSFTFRPAQRPSMPLIIGLAGPTKSGKTKSALRIASGLANGGKIAMINTEGPRGHQYADQFKYEATELTEPFSMKRYEEAIKMAASIKPAVTIIDSMSHAHEGIGGMLDQHESELNRLAGNDFKKRDRMNFAAWVKPKRDEATMINTMLQVDCHIILCFRAKEKIKIVRGQEPIDLGWQPIASDRINFETVFTLVLPPHSKGSPDMSASELRDPFDSMIPNGEQLTENIGELLYEWAKGGVSDNGKNDTLTEIRKWDESKKCDSGFYQAFEAWIKKESPKWAKKPYTGEIRTVVAEVRKSIKSKIVDKSAQDEQPTGTDG